MRVLPLCHTRLALLESPVSDKWPWESPEVTELIYKLKQTQLPLDSPLWNNLIERLCDGGLPAFRFDAAAFQHLSAHPDATTEHLLTLTLLLDQLSQNPLEKFHDITQLHTTVLTPGLIGTVRELLLDLLLDLVNRRLQRLYRIYLSLSPPPVDSTQAERMASLFVLEESAYRLLSHMDIQFLARWLSPKSPSTLLERVLRRLSNYFFDIKKINFRFTHHCNIACRHCYNSSGAQAKEPSLSLEQMLKIIGQMPEAGISRLNLTGGEPFLYLEMVCQLIEAGRKANLQGISIFTNGFWAKSKQRTKHYLERLQQSGFMQGSEDYLKMSSGQFHQEFIPAEQIYTLAKVYHHIFNKKLILDYEATEITPEIKLQLLGQLHKRQLMHTISIRFRRTIPVGRGRNIEVVASQSNSGPCHAIDEIVFDPDGSTRPCCGLNSENMGLIIGNIRQDNLERHIKVMQNDPILQFIATNPLSQLYQRVQGERERPKNYGNCHLCQEAIGDLQVREPLLARLASRQEFYPFQFAVDKFPQSSYKLA